MLPIMATLKASMGQDTCSRAVSNGHLKLLQWARANQCPWNEDTCSNAAGGDHLQLLQWARENQCPWNEDTCSNAAGGGHLELLKWARFHGCPWDSRLQTPTHMKKGKMLSGGLL